MAPKSPRIPTEQLSEESKQLYDVLNDEPDLAVILISTSFLDACLKSILENHFLDGSTSEKMLSHVGVLGTFSSRSDLCYVLGLISKGWFNDLKEFGEIRNLIAHNHLRRSFDDEDIAEKCEKLSVVPLFGMAPEDVSPRTRFKISVSVLAGWLLITALQIKQKPKIKSPNEPRFKG